MFSSTSSVQSGLLVVFADLGDQVTEQEFHEWYDTEHIPLRTSTLSEFLTAARFRLVDATTTPKTSSVIPPWSAIYTISDNEIFSQSAYTNLRAHRSPREAALVKRLGLLDRRIYELISSPTNNPGPKDTLPSLVVLNHFTPCSSQDQGKDDEFLALLESAETRYKTLKGFMRVRRYRTTDVVRSGITVDQGVEQKDKDVGKYLEMIEFSEPSVISSTEYQALTAWYTDALKPFLTEAAVFDSRAYELFRSYEPTAALKAMQ